jgi:N-acetylglutamate synthase-like GNAT family acetyltransferase
MLLALRKAERGRHMSDCDTRRGSAGRGAEGAADILGPTPREATRQDASAITALVNQAFEIEAFFKRGDRTDVDEIRRMMDAGQFLVIDGQEKGSLGACVYAELNGSSMYFGMLSVNPALQGQGVGRTLIDTVESKARAAGCDRIEIHVVNLRTELVPYYQRLGYVETGRLPFPDDSKITQPCHFIVMTKPLRAAAAPVSPERC